MSGTVTKEQGPDLQKKRWSVKRVSIIAVFMALSAVGAMIKIPSPIGTIGLDSCPGYFCALAFGGIEGMVVIAIGHLLSAAVVGFPLSIPIHIVIAATMAIWAIVFRFFGKKGNVGIVIGVIAAAGLNAFGSGLLLIPIGGTALYVANLIPLLCAAAVNALLAAIAYSAVKGSKLLA